MKKIIVNYHVESKTPDSLLRMCDNLIGEMIAAFYLPDEERIWHQIASEIKYMEVFCEWLKDSKNIVARPFEFTEYGFGFIFTDGPELSIELLKVNYEQN